MPSAGYLIYSGIMPLIKTYIPIIAGYVLAKMGLFPKAASHGASQVTMNMALPALIFANVIPAFTPQNVGALGPLFLIAFTYQAIGFFFGLLVRELCYVPRNFWQGIIIMTGMSNWGNLPNAIVLTITGQPPFNPETDTALGVSYVSIFIVAYHLVFWLGGAAHSISWDYLPGVPQGEAAQRHVSWKEKPIGKLIATRILHQQVPDSFAVPTVVSGTPKDEESLSGSGSIQNHHKVDEKCSVPVTVQELSLTRQNSPVSTLAASTQLHTIPLHSNSVTPAASSAVTHAASATVTPAQSTPDLNQVVLAEPQTGVQKVLKVLAPLKHIVTPITITLAIALPIALIRPLKALFVDISESGGPVFKAPDGRPPLAFMIDTADFMGGIAVPLALVMLGASFARLKAPRPLSRFPITAMVLTTLAKMAVLPVIGIFLVQAMTRAGIIHKDEIVFRFVVMFLSGTPTAINQLVVASLYAPDGNTEMLSAFLLLQYTFMFFSSSALTAVALLLL